MVGATTAVMPYKAKAKPRFSGGKVSARIACAIGWSPPPPAPWRARKKISTPRPGAEPHNTELTVKRRIQSRKKRFRPNRPASHPLIGRTTAFAARYDVSTQVLWLLLAARPPAMYGNATLAMLVSRTSMNAANATTTAISQGLNLGCQGCRGGAGDGGSAI